MSVTVSELQVVTANVAGKYREAVLEGRKHLVVPMVMLVEGVLNGSHGPFLYESTEIKKFATAWDHKPIVVRHPVQNGKGVSAATPEVLETQKIGIILNTHIKNGKKAKLAAEAWIDIEKANSVDRRIIRNVKNGKITEVSTGLFMDIEPKEGLFQNVFYKGVARNYRPDHLAVLPDERGASSVRDGAGLLQLNSRFSEENFDALAENIEALEDELLAKTEFVSNGLGYFEIRSQLDALNRLQNKISPDDHCYVDEIYDGFAIFNVNGNLIKQNYEITGSEVSLSGLPVSVIRRTVYEFLDGSPVGNSKKDESMDKKTIVDGIIANSANHFVEADRAYLMGLPEERLALFAAPVANASVANAKPAEQQLPVSVDAYIAAAPPMVQNCLRDAMATYQNKRTEMIDVLATNNCPMTKEQMSQLPDAVLNAMVALVPKAPEPVANQGTAYPVYGTVANYMAAPGAPIANKQHVEAPLSLPKYSNAK